MLELPGEKFGIGKRSFWDAGRVLLQSMTKLNHLISSYANYISWQKKKIFLSDLMMKVLKDTLNKMTLAIAGMQGE